MSADESCGGLLHGDLSERVLKAFYEVYNELGSGFLESVYEHSLAIALQEAGLRVARQQPIEVSFRGRVVGEFRADLVVEDLLIIEVKACSALSGAHEAQLLNYLRATGYQVGLLLNFGPQAQFKRRVYTHPSSIRVDPRSSVAEPHV